ncbi:hypothetical protein FAES_4306 [Fibrella aestuarina BUZ 2]|uniref:Lipoprotein n=1 Tax=Fibrella aestuarina BUZ 2 TaxID=1166018 RepID=I0KDV2_9BACT|nr:hypothetical protein [Fibrella aestuarina]CCH02305.1 hypothetical protein FAES_4306 [Fibrella aestuarina BUZ 2]
MTAHRFLFAIALFVAACSSRTERNNTATDSPKTTAIASDIGYYQLDGDSVVIPRVTIALQLSPKAEAKLKADKETVIVAAFFSGTPKDTTSQEFLESGEVGVKDQKIELTTARVATFENLKFARKDYDALADKDIRLLVNVYSGRRSSPDNLLDCGIVEGPMSDLRGKRLPITGKLIYGDD